MRSIFDKTDDQGRFRLNPYPGVRFGIKAFPPEGTAYQIKRYGGLGEGIRWTSGEESKNIKIELSKGVIATGQVVDAKTGEPIVNASVEYRPTGTNPNDNDDIITAGRASRRPMNWVSSASQRCLAKDGCWCMRIAATTSCKRKLDANFSTTNPAGCGLTLMHS